MLITKNENERRRLVSMNEVSREYGDDSRWLRPACSIVEVDGKYYPIYWDEGLTEMQENYYGDGEETHEEIFLYEYTQIKKVKMWGTHKEINEVKAREKENLDNLLSSLKSDK